jgi:2-(3-amino-3-carboxypropyl)histidine synthase
MPRTVYRLRRATASHVGLQLPEGLTRYATALADIIRRFVPSVEAVTILGDVCFGGVAGDAWYGRRVLLPSRLIIGTD